MLFNGRIAGLTWFVLQWYFERIAKGKVTFSGDKVWHYWYFLQYLEWHIEIAHFAYFDRI